MMRAGLAGWPLWLSVAIHVVGLATVSSVIARARHAPGPVLVAVELVRAEPPAPPAPPSAPHAIPRPSPVAGALMTPGLMPPEPAPEPARPSEPVPAAPEHRYMGSAAGPGRALAVPGEAGAGGLLLPAPGIPAAEPGPAAEGGVARVTGEGRTSLARPLGGYQTTPHYPEAARREGAEGIVTLRFEVLTSGRVGTIQVQRSAGRTDLDRAAVEAIKAWRFEPARRGKEPVSAWVILPVRFELNTR
jgi:protein TonB